jgi:hypothetical protein
MSDSANTRGGVKGDIKFAVRSAIVAAKGALGMSCRGDATFFVDRFDRALRSGRLGKNLAIMAHGKNDGAGSQAQAFMSAICFARAHDLPYIHRPFETVGHAEFDMPAWVRAWEEYFNLGDGERNISREKLPVVKLEDMRPSPPATPTIVSADHYLHFCNRDPNAWERVLPDLRAKFWRNKKKQPRSGPLRIAIHMRRGDVSAEDKKVANNFTPNATFVNTLTQLRALLAANGKAADVEIFSQGSPAMFADLTALGPRLRLDEPALDTHRALIDADILVMSKGAFSYTAGVLHDGVTLYDPQKYRPLQGWIARAPDGSFDESALAARLGPLLAAR